MALVIQSLAVKSPREFGFYRSRCGMVVALLEEDYGVRPSRETVRRWLHEEGLVWRRPCPAPGPKDPQRSEKLRKLRALLRDLPANEGAFFLDEVDVNTNAKTGSMWVRRGQQAEIETPGTNTKRYLAGPMNWRTEEVIFNEAGLHWTADLFLRHLNDLRRPFRLYRRTHVVCDNAIFHRPDRCKKYGNTWRSGDIASFFIFCQPMHQRPTLWNASGGICMNKSHAVAGAQISRNYPTSCFLGCSLQTVSRVRLRSMIPHERLRALSI